MSRKRIMAIAAASLAVAVTAAGIAQARVDLRGETRVDSRDERSAETQLGVPRVADGTIDVQALVNGVDDLVARGVREIEFRDGKLTQDEARSLVLRTDGNLLGDLATRLPNDGIRREITVSGPVDFSVQRQANGELFARIDDIFVGSPTEARRAEFTQQLAAQYGFDRLNIGGVDAAGNRIRVEFDADRGIVRNEALAAHLDGGGDHGDRHGKRRAEAQLAVPRGGDGTIDVQALVNGVENLIEGGVRQIHFRHDTLTQDEAKSLILRTEGNLLGELSARLPNDGIQRQITVRGDVDLRVQRLANGELRAKIDDIFVGSPTEARRAEFTQQLAAQYGFDRLTIRGVDAEGNRIRVEFRADRGIVRNEARAGHRERGEDHAARRKNKDKDRDEDRAKWAKHHDRDDRADRRKDGDDDHAGRGERRDGGEDRRDRAERRERGDGREDRADRRENRHEDRAERGARGDGREHRADRRENGRVDRAVWRENRGERTGKFIKVERVERPERPEQRSDRTERQANFDRPERPERDTKFERPERPERAERAERPERRERAERAERVERPERKNRD